MKRMTQMIFTGLLLSVTTVAIAGGGHDRNYRDGYYDTGHHHSRQSVHYSKHHRYGKKHRKHMKRHHHGDRYYAKRHRHSHHGRYCYAWHPRGYVAPRVHYGYNSPGLVVVYQPREGLYIGGGY